jgi:hypothetical protein
MSSVLRFVSSAAVVLVLVGSTRGYAAPITVDLSSPDTVLTFNEIVLAPSTLMTTQYQALGVTFGPGIYYDPVNLPNSGNFFVPEGLSGHALGNFNDLQGQTATSSIRILFTSPVTEAALRWAGNQQGPFTGTALLGGLLVELCLRASSRRPRSDSRASCSTSSRSATSRSPARDSTCCSSPCPTARRHPCRSLPRSFWSGEGWRHCQLCGGAPGGVADRRSVIGGR